MKKWIFPCLLMFIYACGSHQPQPEKKIQADLDTCFYEISCGADLDMPQTPAWDTTITRTGGCDIQVLAMRSWGTETQYTMSGPEGVTGSCHFTHEMGSNLIDITGMP